MGKEIERKFLLKNNDWKNSVHKEFQIKQGYLNSNPERTTRVRVKGNKGFLTIKGKSVKATRAEYEYEIPLLDAQEMMELCEKPIIEKIRYIVEVNNNTWEIDVFDGENKGLIIAEVELESEDETVILPDWIGQEVTADPRYYNSSLINHPFKNWSC